ncbi:MAG: tetratricopeptide repeat protein [Capsulimonas sp.]|uniref:ATP-binding protein n=1 Tax=Capsulimonas sp. TaxID=2494211 RepID=UPI003263F4DD
MRSRKSLWLLALLVLRAGRPAERDWLSGTLWPDATQSRAAMNLRVVLSELRHALGSAGGRLISPARYTISLDLAGAEVDVAAFDAAISTKSLPELAAAVSLYAGPLLEGCTEEWIDQERGAREQDCLHALQTLADASLAAGDFGAASSYFQKAVALDPWREGAQRGLMEALAGGGDSNAALHVYQAFVRLLRKDDPRASPDEQTTAVYTRLRATARRRSVASAAPSVSEEEPSGVAGNLPSPLTDLIGREDERSDVLALLRRSRLATLTGPGGIGKTRLAIAVAEEAAQEFADGVFFVALDALSDGSQIAPQVASALGLREESGRTLMESVIDHLKPKRVLLVLDNCEHLLDASAQMTAQLLGACAGLRILATSREGLGVTGEAAWTVPGLPIPDPSHLPPGDVARARVLESYPSVQLFVERAQAVRKTFTLMGSNAAPVAQVCARLEGIPLALELAAARVRAMTVKQIAARLDDRLGLLTGGNRTAHSRQQTLKATLDWSYSLLSPPEQRLLSSVSVFSGGWSLEAAEAICSDQDVSVDQVLDLLTSLVDKSLVAFDGDGSSVSGRYRLLEMVRQYANSRLAESGQERLVQMKHRDWFLTLAEDAGLVGLSSVPLDRMVRLLDIDIDNLRAALDRCSEGDKQDAEIGLRMAAALWRFWAETRRFGEGRAILHQMLTRGSIREENTVRAEAMRGAGYLAASQGDYSAARGNYEQSLEIYRQLGDRTSIGRLLSSLHHIAHRQGDISAVLVYYEETQSYCQQSVDDCRARDDKKGILIALDELAVTHFYQGHWTSERKYFEEARKFYEQIVQVARELGNKGETSLCLYNLAVLVHRLGDHVSARTYYEESLGDSRELEDKTGIVIRLHALGALGNDVGDSDAERVNYEESLAVAREIGDDVWTVKNLEKLSALARLQGDYVTAHALIEEEITLCQKLGDREGLGVGLIGMASIKFAQAETYNAVRLWAASETLRNEISARLRPHDVEKYDQDVSLSRAALGEERFTLAWTEGCVLTLEQVMEYALE